MTTSSHQYATAIMVTHNGMGSGAAPLQQKLISTYLTLLNENDYLPGAICFFTEGVRLVTEGSPVIDLLRSLEAKGVRLIVCNTCLKYYDLIDKVQVSIVGGMHDIIEAQWQADKVITL